MAAHLAYQLPNHRVSAWQDYDRRHGLAVAIFFDPGVGAIQSTRQLSLTRMAAYEDVFECMVPSQIAMAADAQQLVVREGEADRASM